MNTLRRPTNTSSRAERAYPWSSLIPSEASGSVLAGLITPFVRHLIDRLIFPAEFHVSFSFSNYPRVVVHQSERGRRNLAQGRKERERELVGVGHSGANTPHLHPLRDKEARLQGQMSQRTLLPYLFFLIPQANSFLSQIFLFVCSALDCRYFN